MFGFITYVIDVFIFDLDADHQRKRFYKKVFKSKNLSLGSIHGPGPATSTSTDITSTTDLMPSISTSDEIDETASALLQVTTGVSVSVQYRPSHL